MAIPKTLNIKGVILNKEQLKTYLENIAVDHTLKEKSSRETYPIPRLIENFAYITKTYDLLNEHLKLGITIHQAGEWLLDNYYVIEETVKELRKNLPLNKYEKFIGISSGEFQGYARSYVVASQIVGFTEGNFTSKDLEEYLESYQNKKTLNMDEIWDINLFFKIALIERIREICEKIYASQMQKLKVESIIERLVELKSKEELKFEEQRKILGSYGENSYTFIEYMSYRLKKYGKKGIAYLNILEEEINKRGLTLQEVIKKEHFDVALKKVSIGNAIKSIHALQRMNFSEVFEKINGVEEILKEDASGTYQNMDYKTKEYYRGAIKEIASKTKISEIYIAKKVVELAKKEQKSTKESHIGYYLIDEGLQKLYLTLGIKKEDPKQKVKFKTNLYIYGISLVSAFIAMWLGILVYTASHIAVLGIIEAILIYIPITEIITKLIQNILSKCVKPKLIPKMDFSKEVPKQYSTMIVIPSIIKSKEKVKELIQKLEVYYLANKSKNIYCTLLGDCTSGDLEKEKYDDDIIKIGQEEVERLNQKYKSEEQENIFNFIYRKRKWNQQEKCYMGWERKRGLLTELNSFLINRKSKNTFQINTLENIKNLDVKYIITLDADTELTLNSGIELIEAMAHPLNKPEIKFGKVTSGYGIMQPRVGINLEKSMQSTFSEIFAGSGGVDSYTNAISDTYQDNFGEGIYTGKGIYDVKVFHEVMSGKIKENTVLSHDLLEGSFLRCGLASDICLLDGYPKGYMAFLSRLSRWIRGDYQIIGFLKSNLNKLSKFKIIDNIRRSLVEITVLINILLLLILKVFIDFNTLGTITISFLSIAIPSVLELFNYIIFRKENIKRQKTFTQSLDGLEACIYRGIINIMTIPTKAYISLQAIIKTIYRMCISKENLLEWTTSDEAEAQDKNELKVVVTKMFPNILIGIAFILLAIFIKSTIYFKGILYILAVLFIGGPFIMWEISQEKRQIDKFNRLTEQEKIYVKDIAKRTWRFFDELMNEENSFLPPDNIQESRREKVVSRTSSTNIGLGLLTIVSAYDMGFITLEETIVKLEKTMQTIVKLEKWNGHLYNWYNTKTLAPLIPKYVSTVDSGNFVRIHVYTKGIFKRNIKCRIQK